MVIQWWIPIVLGAVFTVSFAFWGWLSTKVVELSGKIADIEARIKGRELESGEHSQWLQRVECKLNSVREDVAGIRGAMEHLGIERRHKTEREG